jgi:hypothetical protein
MAHMPHYMDKGPGTIIGIVLGFFSAWDLSQFQDELQTAKHAAIGAVVGFIVMTLLKWLKSKISKPE